MINEQQIPAEEIKRIEDQAHAAAPRLPRMEEMLAYETGFIKGASREFLRHLNSKPSGLKVGEKAVLDVEHNNSSVVTIRATAKYYSTVTDGKSTWEVMTNRLSAIVSAASTPTLLEAKGETGDPWTAVTHSLPEPHKDCWVVLENGIVAEGLLREDKTWACREPKNWNFIYDVTHWRLNLPPAPPSQIPPSTPTLLEEIVFTKNDMHKAWSAGSWNGDVRDSFAISFDAWFAEHYGQLEAKTETEERDFAKWLSLNCHLEDGVFYYQRYPDDRDNGITIDDLLKLYHSQQPSVPTVEPAGNKENKK